MVRLHSIVPLCFVMLGACADFVGVEEDSDTDAPADAETSGSPMVDIDDGTTSSAPDPSGEASTGGEAPPDPEIPETCGDGVLDVGEVCDDGEATATCDVDCTAAECGDGVKNTAAGEVCDDGGPSASCDDDCTVATCGDGHVNEAAGEECDEGSASADCDEDCTLAACGDGVVNTLAGEVCDGSPSCSADCSSCTANVPTALLDEDFSGGAPGWTLQGGWEIGAASSSADSPSCGYGDPGSDHSPGGDNSVAGTVLGGDVDTAMHGLDYLTSPAIDATVGESLTLSYWRWLNSDDPPYMESTVQVFDGSGWVTLWESDDYVYEQAWEEHTFDLSAYANPALRVRFGFAINAGGAYDCSGWNLDDVRIEALTCG